MFFVDDEIRAVIDGVLDDNVERLRLGDSSFVVRYVPWESQEKLLTLRVARATVSETLVELPVQLFELRTLAVQGNTVVARLDVRGTLLEQASEDDCKPDGQVTAFREAVTNGRRIDLVVADANNPDIVAGLTLQLDYSGKLS